MHAQTHHVPAGSSPITKTKGALVSGIVLAPDSLALDSTVYPSTRWLCAAGIDTYYYNTFTAVGRSTYE